MPFDPIHDELIAWLHQVGDLPDEEILHAASPDSVAKLAQLLVHCVQGGAMQPNPTPEEFLDIVRTLRDNYRSWNQLLGDTLLQVTAVVAMKGTSVAVAVMEEFASNCPWLPLREVAQVQAANYRATT
jgi:hypothetical protein